MTKYDKMAMAIEILWKRFKYEIVIIKNMYEITLEEVYVNQNQQK